MILVAAGRREISAEQKTVKDKMDEIVKNRIASRMRACAVSEGSKQARWTPKGAGAN